MLKDKKSELEVLQRQILLLEEQKAELVARVRELSYRDRDKNNLIRILFDKLPYGVIMFDSDRNVLQINQAASEILGESRQKLTGKNCSEIFYCYEKQQSCPVIDHQQSIDHLRTSCVGCNSTLLRSAVLNGGAEGDVIVESFGDITELEEAAQEKTLALQTKSNFLSNL